MLSLKTHNILDYVGAILLLLAPAIFGFSEVTAARNIFVVEGLLLLAYSLFTNYQFAVWRVIPLGVHMTLDAALGVALVLAPWVLGYRGLITGGQELVHYVLGLGLIGLVAATRAKTESEKRSTEPKMPSRFSTAGHMNP
jgi:hypothetical protein